MRRNNSPVNAKDTDGRSSGQSMSRNDRDSSLDESPQVSGNHNARTHLERKHAQTNRIDEHSPQKHFYCRDGREQNTEDAASVDNAFGRRFSQISSVSSSAFSTETRVPHHVQDSQAQFDRVHLNLRSLQLSDDGSKSGELISPLSRDSPSSIAPKGKSDAEDFSLFDPAKSGSYNSVSSQDLATDVHDGGYSEMRSGRAAHLSPGSFSPEEQHRTIDMLRARQMLDPGRRTVFADEDSATFLSDDERYGDAGRHSQFTLSQRPQEAHSEYGYGYEERVSFDVASHISGLTSPVFGREGRESIGSYRRRYSAGHVSHASTVPDNASVETALDHVPFGRHRRTASPTASEGSHRTHKMTASVIAIPTINSLRVTLSGHHVAAISEQEFADLLKSFGPINAFIHPKATDDLWEADIEYAPDNTGNLICEQLLQDASAGRRMFRNADVHIARPPPVTRDLPRSLAPKPTASVSPTTSSEYQSQDFMEAGRVQPSDYRGVTDTARQSSTTLESKEDSILSGHSDRHFSPLHSPQQTAAASVNAQRAFNVPTPAPGYPNVRGFQRGYPRMDKRRSAPSIMTTNPMGNLNQYRGETVHFTRFTAQPQHVLRTGPPMQQLPSRPCELSTNQIEALITQRIHARRARRFQRADEILYELREYGVEVYDSPHNKWFACDGRSGAIDVNIPPAPGPCELETEEIIDIVSQRLEQRRARNFRDADKLKEFLLCRGVVVNDKDNLWRASDGREGVIEPDRM